VGNAWKHDEDDDNDSTADLSAGLSKWRFPSFEKEPRSVYAAIHDELMLDGNSRQNLATFCQTWLEPEVHRLMEECIDKNLEDKDDYPQSAAIEGR
jgi:glutamate decarboxylase